MKWLTIVAVVLFTPLVISVTAAEARKAVQDDWSGQFREINEQIQTPGHPLTLPAGTVLDPQALLWASDRDALDVLLRRTEALMADLETDRRKLNLIEQKKRLEVIKRQAAQGITDSGVPTWKSLRESLARETAALRREIAFSNPLLHFTAILFIARGVNYGTTKDGDHMITAYYGFNGLKGGGLYLLRDFKSPRPQIVSLLAHSVAENGPFQGRSLPSGAFLSPQLSFDGQTIYFAFSENDDRGQGVYQGRGAWLDSTCYHLFQVQADGSGLRQLTFGPNNDLDPCPLPDGRIVFISDRRGGMHRCGSLGNDVYPEKQLSLHSMKADGSDLFPISWHETHEFQPSVDHHGMLVYTRWDYIDRNDSVAHHLWTCYPDGRDPRSSHGNYPRPYSTLERTPGPGNTFRRRVFAEWGIRAVPGSHRYVATAGPHHGQPFGSLVLIDLRVPDDDGLSQITRITPDAKFPESELDPYDGGRSSYRYGTPWPLSEGYYLCNDRENLYLLDKFGNRELLCALNEVCGQTRPWRLLSPIPVASRLEPPIIPPGTYQGLRADHPEHKKAVISVQNVYRSDLPWPKETRIQWLRIIQVLRKPETSLIRDTPPIGFGEEQLPRLCLGRVPVEEDGSVYFKAPVGVPIYFQAVDQRGMAVQSMRSDTYVHPGGHLACIGCHEKKSEAVPRRSALPLALRRSPSRIEPEVGGVEPVSYHRLVEPVFQRTCLPCHHKEGKGPANLAYGDPLDRGNPLRNWCSFSRAVSRIPGLPEETVEQAVATPFQAGSELPSRRWARLS